MSNDGPGLVRTDGAGGTRGATPGAETIAKSGDYAISG
jgi:hypothetical protein